MGVRNLIHTFLMKSNTYQKIKAISRIKNTDEHLMNDWKNELSKMEEQYDIIKLHYLWSSRIGELFARVCIIMGDVKSNKANRILDLFVLSDSVTTNHAFINVIKRSIEIVDPVTKYYWIYIVKHFKGKISIDGWADYLNRDISRSVPYGSTLEWMQLTVEENAISEQKKKEMGISAPYICIANRESTYLEKTMPDKDCSYHNYRDSHITLFEQTAKYMQKNGIQLVRMGQYYKQKVEFENCIDYANDYYDALMDLILMRDCKFYLGASNGIMAFPIAFAKPLAFVNYVPLGCSGWGSFPRVGEEHLLIFKKYYSTDLERFLTIKEMFVVENMCGFDGHKYEKLNIQIVENSAEEILDLAIEMNERLDGIWNETEEDCKRQQQFWTIMMEHCKNTADVFENDIFHCNIGARFLEKNEFLLEDKVELFNGIGN